MPNMAPPLTRVTLTMASLPIMGFTVGTLSADACCRTMDAEGAEGLENAESAEGAERVGLDSRVGLESRVDLDSRVVIVVEAYNTAPCGDVQTSSTFTTSV